MSVVAGGGLVLRLALATFAVTLSACGGGVGEHVNVTVAKSLGTVQCGVGGFTPETLAKQLFDVGVAVHAQGCGLDGRIYPAVCGAPDGRLAVFDISAQQLSLAVASGFGLLSLWPDATKNACPAATLQVPPT